MTYNRQYCHQALAKRDMNWSVPDPHPYNEALTGHVHPIAWSSYCLQDDHTMQQCPRNPHWPVFGWLPGPSVWPGSAPGSYTGLPAAGRSPTMEICRRFNKAKCITPDAISGTTAVAWHLHMSGIPHIRHHLDDFIIIGLPGSAQCGESLGLLDHKCQCLGVPIAAHKTDGPTTRLKYLGIEVDTAAGLLRLPDDKLHCLQALLLQWGRDEPVHKKSSNHWSSY